MIVVVDVVVVVVECTMIDRNLMEEQLSFVVDDIEHHPSLVVVVEGNRRNWVEEQVRIDTNLDNKQSTRFFLFC